MGLFGSIFGKKTNEVKQELRKIEKRDLLEAIISSALLVAYADGSCDASELSKLEQTLQAMPNLEVFRQEVPSTIQKYKAMFEVNFQVGRINAFREISDIAHDKQEAEDVFLSAITAAFADGEVSADEKVVLKEIAQRLSVSPTSFGLEL